MNKQLLLAPKHLMLVVLSASLLAGCGASYNKSNPSIGKLVRRNLDSEMLKLENTAPPKAANRADAIEQHQAEAIENYRAYIALLPEGPAKQQAMRRLADLLVNQGPQNNSSDQPLTASTDLGPGDGVDGTAGPTTLYQQLLAEAPESEASSGRDRLLYQLARAYLNDGKPAKAVTTLKQLALQYPDSELLGEANLRRGELQFIRKNFADSRQAYEAVLADHRAQQFHEQALYKLSWSLYKLEQYELALDRLHELLEPRIPQTALSVADTQFDPMLTELPRAKRELVQDALRVQSLSLAWLEASKSLEQYLEEREPRHYESLIYARLGELYLSRDRYRDAARTWQAFVERNGQHPHAPMFSGAVIDAWEGAGLLQPVLVAKAFYAEHYAPRSTFWGYSESAPAADASKSDQWVIAAERSAPHIIRQVRNYTRQLAEHYHAQSQTAGGGGDDYVADPVSEAGRWYEHYLSQFPADDETATLSFLYAELLFENQRWQAAALQYSRSAYEWQRHDQAAEAGYGAVLSWRKYKQQLKAANGGKFDAAAIAASEAMIDSSIRLADNYPTHPQMASALVAAVEDLYVLGDLAGTISLAKRVIALEPAATKSLQLTSWLMTAQAQTDQQAHEAAEIAWEKTLGLSQEIQPQALQKQANYREHLAASIYYQAQAHLATEPATAEDLEAAVKDFLRVVSKTPSASIVATAHFDAANSLMRLEAWPRVVEELNRFRTSYASDERQPQVDRKLATAYLALNQPGKAAAEFQRIGLRQSETADTRREALWRSAELYDEAKLASAATEAWQRYLQFFPSPFTAAIDARQRLIELSLAAGNATAALKWQRELLRSDLQGGKLRNERSRFLASRAARDIAELGYQQFVGLDISQPFKQSLRQKKRAMKAAIEAWKTVEGYRYADQASAVRFHMAEIQANLAESLIYSQRPNGLSELAQEEYELLLEEQAEPFESNAIKGHEAVTQLLLEQDILDQWVRNSVQRLSKLYPARWAQQERGVKHVDAN